MKKTSEKAVDLRKKAADQKKTFMLRVRVTADQRRILVDASQKTGLDVSSWLRAIGIERARELGIE